MRKIALLAGVAGALMAAPALAQEQTAGQNAQTSTPQEQQQPQASGSVTLTPGATVTGSDGVLGTLVGVQTGASGEQELTVRGSDGQVRGVPLTGFRQDGANVVVGWSASEFNAAPAITTDASPGAAAPGATPPAATPPLAGSPAPAGAPPAEASSGDGAMNDADVAPEADDTAEPTEAPDASNAPSDDGSGS